MIQASTESNFICSPITVIIDTREQHPYTFHGFNADAANKKQPLYIETIPAALKAGDYSVQGLESRVAIERKSKQDLFGTFISDRQRGIAQLEKLSQLEFAAVVIESSWASILSGPDRDGIDSRSRSNQGKTLYRSIMAWMQRYPNVHWLPMPTRTLAEHTTYRILERFYKEAETATQN